MKATKYIRVLLGASVALAMAACSENAWNNHLEGFEEAEDEPISDVQTIEYTLTAADYSAIASNAANKALAGEDGADALAAVGSGKAFTTEAPAGKYVPAFLESTSFPYYTLTNGAAVKLTYTQKVGKNETAEAATGAQALTVQGDFYIQEVWGDDENYVDAFAPSHPAADYLPTFLDDCADPDLSDYAVVTYNEATQEPVFGGGAEQPAVPEQIFSQTFTESLEPFTVENTVIPDEIEYVWSYGGPNYGAKASTYVNGVTYPAESWLISPEIDLSGWTAVELSFEHVYNKWPSAEFAKEHATLWGREVGGRWKQITIPECTDNTSWTFGNSGIIDLTAFEGKKMQLGFKYVALDGQGGTWEVKNLVINATAARSKAPASRAGVFVPAKTVNAVYHYDGSKWSVPSDFVVLQPSDYTEMGQRYPNLSNAEPFLSLYLKNKFPYAAADDSKYVVWNHYSGGSASYDCTMYTYNGSEWMADSGLETVTDQFVKSSGKWLYSPNVTITLPAGRNQPVSTLYYQACVDWVFENICKPLGDTNIKSGLYYVTSYGNNEYYSGTSAYQGNVDLRASAARSQYPAEYANMTDEQIVALEKERFMTQVMPGALAALHSDAKPVEGVDVLYFINFSVYTGATTQYTATFKVVAPGKFEPVSCTWDDEEE